MARFQHHSVVRHRAFVPPCVRQFNAGLRASGAIVAAALALAAGTVPVNRAEARSRHRY